MNLKKTLQEPMRRRQTRKYEERISSQTVAYHDWILKRKKRKERAEPFWVRSSLSNILHTAAAGKLFP